MSGYPTGFHRCVNPEKTSGINRKNNLFNFYFVLLDDAAFKLIKYFVLYQNTILHLNTIFILTSHG